MKGIYREDDVLYRCKYDDTAMPDIEIEPLSAMYVLSPQDVNQLYLKATFGLLVPYLIVSYMGNS